MPWPLVWAAVLISVLLVVSVFGLYLYQTNDSIYVRVQSFTTLFWRSASAEAGVLPTAAPGVAAVGTPVIGSGPAPAEQDLAGGLVAATATPTLAAEASATPTAGPTTTPTASPTPSPTPTPLPAKVELTGFRWEAQGFNNCGPASLAVNLSYWGWQGTQKDTAAVLKPNRDDKNVSPIEIYNYLTSIGYNAYIRNNGDVEVVKRFIAAGYPVLIEKGLQCGPSEGSRCQGWFGHYSVFSGYDDATRQFTIQDTFRGADKKMGYDELMRLWRAFNYNYTIVFPNTPEREAQVVQMLGSAADLNTNYVEALERARSDVQAMTGEDQAFSWFNVGTNLHYQQDYYGAAQAFDQAREIGLPYRMIWYQFGPYRAYYYTGRFQDVIDLATAAINSTPNPGLEEAYFWRGLAREALGQTAEAIADYRTALQRRPGYQLAQDALARLGATP